MTAYQNEKFYWCQICKINFCLLLLLLLLFFIKIQYQGKLIFFQHCLDTPDCCQKAKSECFELFAALSLFSMLFVLLFFLNFNSLLFYCVCELGFLKVWFFVEYAFVLCGNLVVFVQYVWAGWSAQVLREVGFNFEALGQDDQCVGVI